MSDKHKSDNSGALFDEIKRRHDLPNDYALSKFLSLAAPTISKIRTGLRFVTAAIKLRIHQRADMSIAEIDSLIDTKKVTE